MIGAITGDIVGSVYEWHNIKSKEFPFFTEQCFFTDDSVLTIALADTILIGTPYVENLKRFYEWYPTAGYGGRFRFKKQPIPSWMSGCEKSRNALQLNIAGNEERFAL
jgi:ADP-ribosylglycohydrolase